MSWSSKLVKWVGKWAVILRTAGPRELAFLLRINNSWNHAYYTNSRMFFRFFLSFRGSRYSETWTKRKPFEIYHCQPFWASSIPNMQRSVVSSYHLACLTGTWVLLWGARCWGTRDRRREGNGSSRLRSCGPQHRAPHKTQAPLRRLVILLSVSWFIPVWNRTRTSPYHSCFSVELCTRE